jgi:hypothetical protein
MPHAMFFHDGFAIQGAPDISRLGGPVSHGGVRAAPGEPGDLVRAGRTRRGAQYPDRDFEPGSLTRR